MEHGYIFDIKRFAIHDGPGIRTTIFFKGCPLRCWWCHNPESQKDLPEKFEGCNTRRGYNRQLSNDINEIGKNISSDYLLDEIMKDKIFFEESGGGVTFSGGEPFVQTNFLSEILSLCKNHDINTIIDTSGYAPWHSFEKVLDNTNLFLYDLKILDNSLHEKYTGVSSELIIQNLLNLDEIDKNYIIRIPIIPGYTDTEKNIESLISLLKDLKNINGISLLPYHGIGKGKYERYKKENLLPDISIPDDNHLNKLKTIFNSVHSNVKIGG